jgi:cytochrome c oxidase subunit IV
LSHLAESQEELELEHHPQPRQYVMIAVILAIVTAVEVAIFYIEALEGIIVPLLLVLSLAKFVMVVGYFMHLKFDSKLFRYLFVTGLGFALFVFGVVLVLFFVANGGPLPGGASG